MSIPEPKDVSFPLVIALSNRLSWCLFASNPPVCICQLCQVVVRGEESPRRAPSVSGSRDNANPLPSIARTFVWYEPCDKSINSPMAHLSTSSLQFQLVDELRDERDSVSRIARSNTMADVTTPDPQPRPVVDLDPSYLHQFKRKESQQVSASTTPRTCNLIFTSAPYDHLYCIQFHLAAGRLWDHHVMTCTSPHLHKDA